jgi:tetratricopeptide (TPR) repeat protein/predicted O-methyltransferase YrrM
MTHWQLKTPVVLLIFNRPDITAKVFERIRQAQPPKLFVVADGSRSQNAEDEKKCQEARKIIEGVDWKCEVFKNYSDVNLGCRQRVSSGLTWVFNQVEEAIILEDDCLPDPSFFRFCDELLEKYRFEQKVMAISGDNFQLGRSRTEFSYYFSRYPHCWGWATWRRAWQHYDHQMLGWKSNRRFLEKIFEREQAIQYWSGIFDRVANGFNSWAYVWTYTCWIHQGLVIIPESNLVSNFGFNSEGTHTTQNSPFAEMEIQAMNFPLRHPSIVQHHAEADDFTEINVFSGGGGDIKVQNDGELLVKQAIESLNANQTIEALTLFDRAIQLQPEQPGLNYGKSVSLARLGRIHEAIETLNQVLNFIPDHRKAKQLLDELSGSSSQTLMSRAESALKANKLPEAFQYLVQAKSLKQPIQGLDVLRASYFLRLNQPHSARQALQEELRYFPNNTEAKILLDRLESQYPVTASPAIGDAEFQELLKVVRPYTMLSEARLYSLFALTKRICVENVPGNIIECGVAGGGSTALMAAVIQRYTKQPRWLFAFDSFEGMPTPTLEDKHGGIPAEATGWGTGTCAAPEASVREICTQLGVSQIVKTVKGYFQDTLPRMRNMVGMVSLLHMDGDWYESTQVILQNLYDRVVSNGLIQVDDYGFWEGCRQAVHEFETQRQIKFEIQRIDDTGVWFPRPDKFPLNSTISPSLIQEFYQDDPVAYGVQSQMSINERFQLYYALRQLILTPSFPLRFLEIGSFAGSSLLLTVRALKRQNPNLEGLAIDPGGHPQLYKVLEYLAGNVTHLRMFSQQAVPQLRQKFSDGNLPTFMFIDGDHTYEGVKQDISNYFGLLAPGGVMLFHDYLPPLDDENRESILFHHAGNEPGIRRACQELMEGEYGCEVLEIPLLYPTDPTQTQAHFPIIPKVFSTIRAYRKPKF